MSHRTEQKHIYHAPKWHVRPPEAQAPAGPQNARTARRGHPVRRALAAVGVLLAALTAFLLAAVWMICRGPSPAARDLLVNTVMETSAAKFVARIFLSEEEVQAILDRNGVLETGEVTSETGAFEAPEERVPPETIELHEVNGDSFKGKMMVVHDPGRVRVAALASFDAGGQGKKLADLVAQEGAVAGINGGGFADEGGVGSGSVPLGIVIQNGTLRAGSLTASYSVIGFDGEDRLVVGRMTGQQALDKGLRDAISFGPAFIVNGKAAEISGTGGGLNPRTVIGQRADGAVLLLVIDGRQPQSLGATYQDCVQVMQEWGAVNAANLDGGSSTQMIYEGETVNVCASLYGPRKLPTAIVVDAVQEGGNG